MSRQILVLVNYISMIKLSEIYGYSSILCLKNNIRCQNGIFYRRSSHHITQNLTVQEAYEVTREILRNNDVSEPDDSARYLTCYAAELGYQYSRFHQSKTLSLNHKQILLLQDGIEKRLKRMPIQYIVGNWDFYGLEFRCIPPILIPRPETEELVERVLSSVSFKNIAEPKILDIGAGTGAIGIALLSHLPNAICHAIDINENAVKLANENAKSILKNAEMRYKCINKSLEQFAHDAIESKKSSTSSSTINMKNSIFYDYDLIVSNPPYIPSTEMKQLESEVCEYEDHRALHGGEDGLDIIKEIIVSAPTLLDPTSTREVWMEVSHTHPELIDKKVKSDDINDRIFRNSISNYRWYKDLFDRPRFITFQPVIEN